MTILTQPACHRWKHTLNLNFVCQGSFDKKSLGASPTFHEEGLLVAYEARTPNLQRYQWNSKT